MMLKPLHFTGAFLGTYAGVLACQHGTFEILQGPVAPGGLMIQAIGPPCQPEAVWHGCFPAMTLIPNLLISGYATLVAGLLVIRWSAFFLARRHGGLVLALFALLLLPVGGGFVPVLIGVVAGVAASRLDATPKPAGPGWRLLAHLWPWALLLMAVWFPGSWLLGYFFNQAMLATGGVLFLFFDIALPVLTALGGVARQKIT
ncbi:MAG: hypothetical protein ACOYYS_03865 [Chloroflexota bacterium]